MKSAKCFLGYALTVVVVVIAARYIVLDVQAKKLKDPASFSTCDEPQPDEGGGSD
jgi:hypothetical protein